MCCSDYFACVSAVIWSIAQTTFHIGWCAWGISMYECKYQPNQQTFMYFWYLTYFYKNSCVNATMGSSRASPQNNSVIITGTAVVPMISLINPNFMDSIRREIRAGNNSTNSTTYTVTKENQLVLPAESAVAERTYNIFLAFLIIDLLWMIAAVGLLIGTCCRVREGLSVIFFFPWCVVLLVILFFDGIATGWYGIDISYTHDFKSWFVFIGGQNYTDVDKPKPNYLRPATSIPSALMMIFFSRFFLIWFINLYLFFRIVQAAINAIESFDDDDSYESKHPNQGQLGVVTVNNRRPRQFQVRDINPNSSAARIRRWQLYYGTDEEDEKEMQEIRRPPHRRASKQKQQTAKNEGWQKDTAFQYNQSSGSGKNLRVSGGYEGDRSNSPSPLPDYGEKHIRNPFNNRYSSGYESNDICVSFNEGQGTSSPDYVEIYDGAQKQHQSCIGELRAQLPWSYFQDRTDSIVLKGRTHDETMPSVPVPDYTLQLNQK